MRTLVLLSNVIVWAIVAALLLVAPPEIPLYYSRFWGEAQIATKWELILLPLLMNIAFYVTHWFVHKRFVDEPVFARIARAFLFTQAAVIITILARTFFLLMS